MRRARGTSNPLFSQKRRSVEIFLFSLEIFRAKRPEKMTKPTLFAVSHFFAHAANPARTRTPNATDGVLKDADRKFSPSYARSPGRVRFHFSAVVSVFFFPRKKPVVAAPPTPTSSDANSVSLS